MIVHEFLEPLPIEHKVLGKGEAILAIIGNHDNCYTCIINRALVDIPQNELLVQRDYSNKRGLSAQEVLGLIKLVTGEINDCSNPS